jgi:hypothetical protein
LDDRKCAKLFPATKSDGSVDRDWKCEVSVKSTPPSIESGYQADTLLHNVKVDTETLMGVVNDTDVNLCVILSQRVANSSSPTGITLYNKYMCAGDYSATVAYETWSR